MRVIALLLATLALTTVHVCADQTFSIIAASGTEGLSFNISGTTVVKPTLNVTFGETITFRIEKYFEENGAVPFGLSSSFAGLPGDFSSAAMGSLTATNSCIPYSTNPYAYYVNQTTGIPCIITWKVVAPEEGTKFYYASRNQVYTGVIEVAGLPTSGPTTTPTTGSNTTSTPTTTTAPTTTPQPTGSSSTGKNGAAIVVPGAAAFIIAAINALVA